MTTVVMCVHVFPGEQGCQLIWGELRPNGVQLAHRFWRLRSPDHPQAHLTHVSSLSGRAPARIRPVIREPPAEVPAHGPRFPAAVSATGIRFLGHPSPAGELSLPHGRPTGTKPPDPNGVVVLHMSKTQPGRAPPLPRGRWCAPGRRLSSGRHPPLFRGQSLRPRQNIPPAGLTFTRRHQGFTHVRPSPPGGRMPPQGREALPPPAGLLLACRPRMGQGPLRLLPRAPHPAVTRGARQGGDGPTRTGPGTAPPASTGPPTAPPT